MADCGMPSREDSIKECLCRLASERERLANSPGLKAASLEVKRFQHARFQRTYADLLNQAGLTLYHLLSYEPDTKSQ